MAIRDDRTREGVIALIEHECRWLFIRRAEGVIAPGFWCFPGGGIESGETQAQAVVREIREELGIAITPHARIWQLRRPDDRLILHWWRVSCEADELERISPNPVEVAEVAWLDPDNISIVQPHLTSTMAFLAAWRNEDLLSKPDH